MPIEILFLSGSRQGERIQLDATEFRAGDQPDCRIFFNPAQDPDARGRAASFRLQEDGWHVENAGDGELLINDQRLTGSRRIRSGDVVRMSDCGPDFTFSLVARVGPVPQEARALAAGDKPAVQIATSIPVVAAVAVVESPPQSAPQGAWSWPTALPYVGGGLIVAMLFCGLAWLISGSPASPKSQTPAPQVEVAQPVARAESPPKPELTAAAETPKPTVPAEPTKAAEPAKPAESQVAKTDTPDKAPTPATPTAEPAPPAPSGQVIGSQAGKAIFLLCVEDTQSKSIWPFATATAVSDKLLLTTATVAAELTRFRQDSSRWNIWACQDPNAERFALKDLRVHRGYAESGDSAEKKVYFDVALISVDQTLPATVPLASAKILAELGRGYPLVCVGISHKGEPVNRFESLQPQSVPAKVFAITALEPAPSAPRLLHINESIPPNFFGAPLITAEGSLAAVYSTPAGAGEGEAAEKLHMHYAVVIEPQLIDLWKQGRGDDVWMAPTPAPDPSPVPSRKP
jgi:hypothetical protein